MWTFLSSDHFFCQVYSYICNHASHFLVTGNGHSTNSCRHEIPYCFRQVRTVPYGIVYMRYHIPRKQIVHIPTSVTPLGSASAKNLNYISRWKQEIPSPRSCSWRFLPGGERGGRTGGTPDWGTLPESTWDQRSRVPPPQKGPGTRGQGYPLPSPWWTDKQTENITFLIVPMRAINITLEINLPCNLLTDLVKHWS